MAKKQIEKIRKVWLIEAIEDDKSCYANLSKKGDMALYTDEQTMLRYCHLNLKHNNEPHYNIYECELMYVHDLRKIYKDGKFGCLEVPIINRWLNWRYEVINHRDIDDGKRVKYTKDWANNYVVAKLEDMVHEFTTNKHAGYYATQMRKITEEEMAKYNDLFNRQQTLDEEANDVYNTLYEHVKLATTFMHAIRGHNTQENYWNLPTDLFKPKMNSEIMPTEETIKSYWESDMKDFQDCLDMVTLLTGNIVKPKWENANLAMLFCYTNGWRESRNVGKFFSIEHKEVKGNMLDNLYNSTNPLHQRLVKALKWFVSEKKPLKDLLHYAFYHMFLDGSKEFVAISTHKRLTSMWKSKNLLFVLTEGNGVYTFVYHNPDLANASYILDEENKNDKLQELLLNNK